MKKSSLILTITSLMTLAACGNNSSKSSTPVEESENGIVSSHVDAVSSVNSEGGVSSSHEAPTTTSLPGTSSSSSFEASSIHVHDFKQVADDKYLVSKGDCTTGATYHPACECGEVDENTTWSTEAKGHVSDKVLHKDESGHYNLCAECGEKLNFSEHFFGDPVVTKLDTHDSEGEQTLTCALCKYEKVEPYQRHHQIMGRYEYDENEHWHECMYQDTCAGIKFYKYPHNFEERTKVYPTYETEGLLNKTCRDCKYSVDVVIPCREHIFSDYYSYDTKKHWRVCEDAGYGDLYEEMEEHDIYLSSFSYATYEKDGYSEYHCRKCGYNYRIASPALVHQYSKTPVPYDEDDHAYPCTDAGYGDLNKLEMHDFKLTEDVVGTDCMHPGHVTYHCTTCGYDRVIVTNDVSHNMVYSQDILKHWSTCSTEGCTHETTPATHSWISANNVWTCQTCNASRNRQVASVAFTKPTIGAAIDTSPRLYFNGNESNTGANVGFRIQSWSMLLANGTKIDDSSTYMFSKALVGTKFALVVSIVPISDDAPLVTSTDGSTTKNLNVAFAYKGSTTAVGLFKYQISNKLRVSASGYEYLFSYEGTF